ncbi:MAG: response regulator [Desulfuromonadales bacterium]|nr:response regulator [Desulfuromonadales bacterium]
MDAGFIDKNILHSARVFHYSNFKDMLSDLSEGKIDFFIANDAELNFSISNLELLNLHYPDTPFFQVHIKAGVLKQNSEFLAGFNQWIENISLEDRQRIIKRWSPQMKGYRLSWPLIGLSIIILISSSLALAVWMMNLRLKAQVAQATKSLIAEKEALSQAKENAVNTQKNIKALLDSLKTCIFSLDSSGNITHLNSHAEKWMTDDCPSDTRRFSCCFPFLADFEEEILETLRKREAINFYRQKIQVGNSHPIISNIRLKPIEIEGNSQALILIDDVTEAALKESLLIQSQKLEVINSLAGGMAHDFNNVLAVISGSANLLGLQIEKADSVASEKIKKYIDNIFKATEKGAATTKSLATLSGRVSIDFAEFSINEAVENVMEICRSTMDKSVSISIDNSPKNYVVNGNQGLIEQALLNIMINAYHAMTIMKESSEEYGGLLRIQVQSVKAKDLSGDFQPLRDNQVDHYVKLHIQDDGVGLSKEELSQVFTPFYTTKAKGVGTGLGLTMVQNTILQHQGQIIIESQEGKGTDVFIYLPCTCVEKDLNGQLEHLKTVTGNCSIREVKCLLLVDDNPLITETLGAGLEAHGFEVIIAANGIELLEAYKQNSDRIDVVITDLEMPMMNGDTAFFELKKMAPEAKIIMMSGYLEDTRVQKVLQAGANGFLQKPCKLQELLDKVASI